MQKREINPTEWIQAFNLNQAIEVTGGQRVLYLSGQTSNAADGSPMHSGDLVAQFSLAWVKLERRARGSRNGRDQRRASQYVYNRR